jgi:F-type H+-transporting ATPase subunit gamma
MESLHALQKHIDTSGKLQSIVGSMKTLSAVNIRQYEQAAHALDTYQATIEAALQAGLNQTDLPVNRGEDEQGQGQGLVIFGSDQGLCGRFNENLVEFLLEAQRETAAPPKRLILVSGARIAARLEAEGVEITEMRWSPGSLAGVNRHVYEIILALHDWRYRQGIKRIDLFFNRHEPGGIGTPSTAPLLPLGHAWLRQLAQKDWPGTSLPYSATPLDELFSALIQQYLFVAIYRAQVQSLASEQATRLYSLQRAEKNIEEHLEELIARSRNVRQSVITSELLDLVAGFRTVTGHDD